MNLSELINEIISEWAYRCDDGMPNPKNQAHLNELSIVLKEMGLSHIKDALVENLLTEKGKTPDDIEEADTKKFTNPILNKIVKYKSDKGEDKEGVVGNLLRQPEDSPGRKAAEAMLPPEGSPERDTMNQELGGEGQPKKPDAGKEKGGDEKAGGGEADKAKQAQAMFDPKADPAMAARMDKEKEVQAKLAKDAEADKAGEKSAEAPSDKAKDEFKPIDAADVQQEMPQADPETFGGGSDIPDGIPAADLQKFNTDIDKVAKEISDAKERGEKAPNINLCDVTVPGTNLYCDDNLGIPRDQMPQFKGKPQPGTPAADMPVDEKGDVDTEPLFKKMLEDEGIKVVQTEVPADKLKATQSELVGDKVIGMMNALENDPNHPSITAPIYVSRDGYVIDGHHRWAAITAYNAKHPDNQIPMKVQAIDKDIKDAIPMCNDFAEKQGVAAKKADANNESDIQNVTSLPEPKPEDPEEKKNWFQKQKERIQQKIKVMSEAGKQFFGRGGHKPGSVPRRTFGQALVDKIKGIPKAVVDGIKHHAVMFKDAGVAIFEAGVHGGLGTIEDPETGERFNHDDHIAVDANGKKRYEKIPQYETDSHGHIIKDPETGKPMQKRHWLTGNLMTEDRPIPNEDMTEKQKELFYKSYQKEKKQIKAIVGTGKAIMITAAGAYGLSAAMGHAYTTAGQLMTSTAIELVPHTIVEGTVLGIGKAALYAGAVEMNSKAKLDEFGTKLVKTIGEFISGDKEIPEDVLANAMELYNNVDKLRENIDKVPEDEGFLKDYVQLHDQIEKDGNETSDASPKEEPKMKEEHIDLANELMLEMIYGFINEAGYQKADDGKFWVKNKKSGEVYTVSTPNPKSHDAPTPAQIKKATADGKTQSVKQAVTPTGKKSAVTPTTTKKEPVAGAELFGQDYKDARGGGEKDLEKSTKPAKTPKELEKITNELYGKDGKGPLLQNSPTSDSALKNGYTEGEWWVAPGNAGSNFNENMSNEAACILKKHPDLTEEELAMIIFRKANGTKLGAQQANPAIKSKNKIKVPDGLSKEEQILYKNCVITARSGRTKYDRAVAGVEECKKQVGFGEIESVVGYGGTSKKANTPEKVKTDRENMLADVDSANNCYIYDDETGKVYKIEKEDLKKWIKSSGGGENAADTVVLTKDKNGNLLYDGWSDKKTLGDLQANGTLYNDMIQSGIRVQEMIDNGQIDKKDASKAKKIIDDGANEIKLIERGYSTIASSHSNYFLGVLKKDPQQFKKMEEQAASNPETKKHYKNWTDTVSKITDGRGVADAKSVAIAEEISGEKRKKSKEEIAADKFIQDTLDKYGEDTVATLLKNPDIDESVKKEIKKADDAGKKGRKEYMNKFNSEWLTDKKNKTKIKSISPFRLLNNVQIKYPSVVSENERKIIDRTAALERQKYIKSGEKIPKTIDTQNALESMRKKAFSVQRGIFENLAKIKAKTTSGRPTNAAAVLGFKDSVAALHLDKISLPKDEKDINQILKRSTNLVMEGVRVSPKNIKDCLGVDDRNDLEDIFVVDFTTDKFITNADGNVTGKTIAIYLVDKNNQRREISPKVYRPKSGPTGKTANTLAWSDDMQKCFDSKK